MRVILERLGFLDDWPEAEPQLRLLSEPLRTSRQLELLAAAPRRIEDAFQFAVLGDAEPGRFWFSRKLFNKPDVFVRQLGRVQGHPIDFTIQLGDMVSRGIHRNYYRFFRDLHDVGLEKPYLTVIGNHDRHSPHSRSTSHLYRACFGRPNYYFDHGGVRFVSLDSSARCLTATQLRWLDLVLRVPALKVVFTHIPPSTLRDWTDIPGSRGIGGFRRGAEEFTAIMSRRGVDRVYLGHIHAFGVQDHGGVRYVLTGGGGSPLFPSGVKDRFHHYIVATASPAGIEETVHSDDGTRFAIPRGKVIIAS